jgi:hypothetical protein
MIADEVKVPHVETETTATAESVMNGQYFVTFSNMRTPWSLVVLADLAAVFADKARHF